MSDTMRWYVVHTYSGYENKVATNIEKAVENRKLHDLIGEVKVPTETVVEVTDKKKREVERKIFPGYVLVKMIMTEVNFAVGDSVRVADGYLEGFIGVVDEIDLQNALVRVTVSMMGKEVPVELELYQIEPLD